MDIAWRSGWARSGVAVGLAVGLAVTVVPDAAHARQPDPGTTTSSPPSTPPEPLLPLGDVTARVRSARESFLSTPVADRAYPDRAHLYLDSLDAASRTGEAEAAKLDAQLAAADGAQAEELRARRARLRAEAADLRRELIGRARSLIEQRPDEPRAAEVLLLLAAEHLRQGQTKDASWTYVQLVNTYPKSPRISEAWARLGDIAFDAADIEQAMEAYGKAIAAASDPTYMTYARYKRGWCHYNLAEFDKAKADLEVVAKSERLPRSAWSERLVREARRDLVRVYAEVGAPPKAPAYFDRLAGDGSAELLRRLAEVYDDQGRFPQGRELWRVLAARAVTPLERVHFLVRASRDQLAIGYKAETLKAIRELLDGYGALKASKGSEADKKAGLGEVEPLVRELAGEWEVESWKNTDDSATRLASELHRLYLARLPESPHVPAIRFGLGRLLFRLQRYADAADALEEAARTLRDERAHKEASDLAQEARTQLLPRREANR